MENFTVKDIVKITNGNLANESENIEIKCFSKDTRTLKKGDLYVGIKGDNFDGNLLYNEAYEKGAIAVLLNSYMKSDKDLEKYSNIIFVDDTVKALQDLASYRRKMYDIPVVAVTGSVGKTSTKDMIASVVSTKYKVLKTRRK